jgi:hypothetical protein
MMNRWGQNAKEMAAITKYLETQNVSIRPSNHPLVGGVEIDLPALYHAVQSFGGLTEVIQKKKWGKIADFLRVPKGTQVSQWPIVPLLLLGPPFFPIILFLSTTLLTRMTGISLHMQWPLTSQSHGSLIFYRHYLGQRFVSKECRKTNI